MDWQALELSFKLASCTTFLLLVLGLPLAYGLALSRKRWTCIVEAVVALPLVLPPTVLGFYLLVMLGPRSPLGRVYEHVTGRLFPFSFIGLLTASVLYALPFAVQPFMAAFTRVDRRLLEAASCLGASRLETFWKVALPLSREGILTGMVLSFAHTLGEFGVVLMVGGDIPGVTRTISIAIYDDVQALNYAAAGQTALVLLVISFCVLVLTYALQWRRRWPIGTANWK